MALTMFDTVSPASDRDQVPVLERELAAFFDQPLTQGALGDLQIVLVLDAQPPSLAQAEVAAQAQVGIGGDGALPEADLVDPGQGDTGILGQTGLGESQGDEELFGQHFAGMDRGQRGVHGVTLVVVDKFDGMGGITFPGEAQPPLAVDPDAVLAFSIALQRLQAVPWRDLKVCQGGGGHHLNEFAPGRPAQVVWPSSNTLALGQPFRVWACKTGDHACSISLIDILANDNVGVQA